MKTVLNAFKRSDRGREGRNKGERNRREKRDSTLLNPNHNHHSTQFNKLITISINKTK
jgi:hypothetical protein